MPFLSLLPRLRQGSATFDEWRRDLGFEIESPKTFWVVIAIGAALRFWNLGNNPAGFFCDEAWIGVAADSMLRSGRDTYDHLWPILFKAEGGWRSPAVVYGAMPWVWLFGLTEFAVRAPSALMGLGTIFFVYRAGKELASERAGLVAALLLAVSPWHVHVSRLGFDAHPCTFFGAATFYFVLRARNFPYAWPAAGLAIAGLLFSYVAAFLQTCFFVAAALVIFRREVRVWWNSRAFRWTVLGAGIPTAALVIFAMLAGMLFTRYQQTAPDSRAMTQFFYAMLRHFSESFLARLGESGLRDAQIVRHSILGIGLLLPGQYTLFVIGAVLSAFRARYRPEDKLLLALLLITPIPAALVGDVPSATRSVLMVIPVTLLSALAVEAILQRLPERGVVFAQMGGVAATIFGVVLLTKAMIAYPKISSGWSGWQHGYRDAVRWGALHSAEYEGIYVSHLFNAGNELKTFYSRRFGCDNCRVMNNPIEIDVAKRQ